MSSTSAHPGSGRRRNAEARIADPAAGEAPCAASPTRSRLEAKRGRYAIECVAHRPFSSFSGRRHVRVLDSLPRHTNARVREADIGEPRSEVHCQLCGRYTMSIRYARKDLSSAIIFACMSALPGLALAQALDPVTNQKQPVLDCASLANSAFAEPASFAEQCLPYAPAGVQGFAPVPQAPTDPGFAYDMRDTTSLYSYILNNFAGQTLVGSPGDQFYAWDFDPTNGTLYTIKTGAGTFSFGTVDTATAAFTPIVNVSGDVPPEVTGLTIAADGSAFMSSGTNLYSFDLATGVATLIGPFDPGVTL